MGDWRSGWCRFSTRCSPQRGMRRYYVGQPGRLTYDAEAVDPAHKKATPDGLQERVYPEMLLESWVAKE